MLSAYEQQRLENIERNRLVLVALGLADESTTRLCSVPARKPPRPKEPPPTKPNVIQRSSARACGRPATYAEGLSDRDFIAEERAVEYADRRRLGGGRTLKPIERYEPPEFPRPSKRQRDDDDVVNSAVPNKKTRALKTPTATVCFRPSLMGTGALLPAEIATVDKPQIPYYTSGAQGRCPRCQNWFTITGSGKLHKHICSSAVVTAVPVLPPVS